MCDSNDSRNFQENSVLWYLSRTSTFALSQGASSFKMKFGHRGANHPVKNLETGKVDITSQNHGYAIDIDSLKSTDLEVTHLALMMVL